MNDEEQKSKAVIKDRSLQEALAQARKHRRFLEEEKSPRLLSNKKHD